MRQVKSGRFKKANPKFEINTNVLGTPAPPKVVFSFVDDTEVREEENNMYPPFAK